MAVGSLFQLPSGAIKMNANLIRVNKAIETIVSYFIAVFFAGLVIAVTAGVVTRYASFGQLQWQWPEEVSRLLLVWLVWLSSAIGCINFTHMKIDYFFFLLPPKIKNAVYILVLLIVAAFLGCTTIYGIQMTRTAWAFRFAAFDLSQGYINLALPVSGILMFYFTIMHLINFILNTYSHGKQMRKSRHK